MNIRFGKKFSPIPPHMSLVLKETKPANEESVKDVEPGADNDGPGAGGGYDDSVEINPSDDDGPGAGGGYDDDSVDSDPQPHDADGPGAGGGYDDSDDVKADPGDSDGPGAGGGYDFDEFLDFVPTDADGPGAGGGYDGLAEFSSLTGTATASWGDHEASSSKYFLSDAITGATYTSTEALLTDSDWALDIDFGPIVADVTFGETEEPKSEEEGGE